LQWLGQRRREQVVSVARVHPTVCAHGDNGRVGVLAIRAFDVSSCPFAIDYKSVVSEKPKEK
jgi:hypothetical protein